MADTNKAGAIVPADLNIDREAAASWDAFKLMRVMADEDADAMAKLDAAVAYAGLVSGLTEDQLVDIAGGGRAPIARVMEVVAAIVAEAAPKN